MENMTEKTFKENEIEIQEISKSENAETGKEEKQKSKKLLKKMIMFLPSVLCVICGVIIMISGIVQTVIYDEPSVEYTHYEYYGGDAYTGIQQASADASRNAKEAAWKVYNLVKIANTFTILFGLFVLVFGLMKIVDTSLKIEVIDNRKCQIEKI